MEDGLVTEDMTFEQWATIWFEDYKKRLERSTQEGYRYTLRKLIEHFGKMKLKTIKTMHVEQYLQQMKDDGLSSSYIAKLRGLLFQILNKAEANDFIRKNPVRFAEKMKNDGPTKKKESFTVEEVQLLMKHLPYDRIGLSIRVMLGTGLRGQELLALEPQHIEPDGSMIYVRQAVKMESGVPYVGTTKSRDSMRDIPVPKKIRPYLMALRSYSKDGKYIWESPRVPERTVNPSSFRKDFKAALEKVEGVRVFTPHACRHTYVSQLQAHGVDMETIQSLVGHADTQMTEKYLHVQKEIKDNAIEKLGTLFDIA
ncbi:MAG: site-specific integrase [Oscillospiraceae bacterium]|nr:site-specific integrase [Oscillospiraceae bacterium]